MASLLSQTFSAQDQGWPQGFLLQLGTATESFQGSAADKEEIVSQGRIGMFEAMTRKIQASNSFRAAEGKEQLFSLRIPH